MQNNITKIGIFGGGQLGRMMAQAALPLNIQCTFFEAQADCPSSALGQVYTGSAEQSLDAFIQSAEVFTLEFENTPIAQAQALSAQKTLYPPHQALAIAQNRLKEKRLFDELNIPVAPYRAIASLQDLEQASQDLGLPIVLKTATGGYDGKGQFIIKDASQIAQAWTELSPAGELIAEGFIQFSREVSIIAVRGQNGEVKTWDLAENHHNSGILSYSVVPAPNSEHLKEQAQQYISVLLNHLNYVGVLTLEMFVTEQGLIANEIAPRVHNSGHWTIEGAVCSQFENHIRAVAGLPLGSTETVKPNVMINIIGKYPNKADTLALEGVHLHLYNKTEREGRKIGHITVMPNDSQQLQTLCQKIAEILPNPLSLTKDMQI